MRGMDELLQLLEHYPFLHLLEVHLGDPPRVRLQYHARTPVEKRAQAVRELKRVLLDLYPHLTRVRRRLKRDHNGRVLHFDPAEGLLRVECQREYPCEESLQTLEWDILEAEALREEQEQTQLRQRMTLFTLLALVLGGLGHLLGTGPLAWLFYVGAYLAGGFHATLSALEALRKFELDVDFLMVVAALGAAYLGHPFEGVILLFLFSLSSTLEIWAMDRSRRALRHLLRFQATDALLLVDHREIPVPPEVLQPGDRVRLRPGEQVPTDARVTEGTGHVDESTLTGESLAVLKRPGDLLYAGTLVIDGHFEAEVTRRIEESTLEKTLLLIREARERKARSQRIADLFGGPYTYAVILGALAVYFLFRFLLGIPHEVSLYRAMVFLVVASPCAVVLSTPASILTAIAHAARRGILFKGGVYVEEMAQSQVVAFDKTGTLTEGRIEVRQVVPLPPYRREEVIQWAASVEALSEHPYGQAIVTLARREGLALLSVEDFTYRVGEGVRGRVNGREIFVGRPDETLLEQARQRKINGESTLVAVYVDGEAAGLLALADRVRLEAPQVVRQLKTLGVEEVIMLTGDRPEVARAVAREVGVDRFYAGLHPEDKVRVVRELQAKGHRVVMVGDGVNDGPVLAAAQVGVAIGGASTDVALETADVVLMKQGLRRLPYALQLARKARRVVLQNYLVALGVIVVMVVLNFWGKVPLTLGVLGHEGSTVLVLLNGLRLLMPLQLPEVPGGAGDLRSQRPQSTPSEPLRVG